MTTAINKAVTIIRTEEEKKQVAAQLAEALRESISGYKDPMEVRTGISIDGLEKIEVFDKETDFITMGKMVSLMEVAGRFRDIYPGCVCGWVETKGEKTVVVFEVDKIIR